MKTLVLVLAMAASLPAAAATTAVWRCGSDGRTYSDTPCAPGREVQVADPRSAEQVAQAREVLAADMRRAEALRREQLQRERLERGQGQLAWIGRGAAPATTTPVKPTALRQSPAKRPAKMKQTRPSDDGIWRATAPASPSTPG